MSHLTKGHLFFCVMGGDGFCFAEGPGVPENPEMEGRKYSIFQNSSCPWRDPKKKRTLPTPRSSLPRGTFKRSLGPTQSPPCRLTFVTPIDRRIRRDPNRTGVRFGYRTEEYSGTFAGPGYSSGGGSVRKDPPIHSSPGRGRGGAYRAEKKKLGSGFDPPPSTYFRYPYRSIRRTQPAPDLPSLGEPSKETWLRLSQSPS